MIFFFFLRFLHRSSPSAAHKPPVKCRRFLLGLQPEALVCWIWCTIRLLLKLSQNQCHKNLKKNRKAMKPPGLRLPSDKMQSKWDSAPQQASSHPTGQAMREGVISLKFRGRGRGKDRGKGSMEAGELSGRSGYGGDLMLEWEEREKLEANSLALRWGGKERKWGGEGWEGRYWSGKGLSTGEGSWKWLSQRGKWGIRLWLWAETLGQWLGCEDS